MKSALPSPSSSAGRSRLRKARKLDPRYRILLACLALLALITCPGLADLLGPILANLLR